MKHRFYTALVNNAAGKEQTTFLPGVVYEGGSAAPSTSAV